MKIIRFAAGAAAGLMDLTGNISARNALIDRVPYTGDTANGFDLIADLYRFRPTLIIRRFQAWRR